MFRYLTCCIDSRADLIGQMVGDAREVSWETFLHHIPYDALKTMFPQYAWGPERGLRLKDDWHVTYYKSRYGGQPCYFIIHSAIEYVFVKRGLEERRKEAG